MTADEFEARVELARADAEQVALRGELAWTLDEAVLYLERAAAAAADAPEACGIVVIDETAAMLRYVIDGALHAARAARDLHALRSREQVRAEARR